MDFSFKMDGLNTPLGKKGFVLMILCFMIAYGDFTVKRVSA